MSPTAHAAPPRLLATLGALVVALACAGYAWTGAPASVFAAREAEPPAPAAHPFEAMVDQLTTRLAKNPDDGAGWALLARSATALGRRDEALGAYAQALRTLGEQPDLLADYADALALRQGGLDGEPVRLLERALVLAPTHAKARLLAGTAAFERGDAAAAVRHWEQLDAAALGDPVLAERLQSRLAEARRAAP